MKPRKSKAIVVDASIARSAGLTENPTSVACRQILDTILQYCHRIAVSQAARQEWSNHASGYSVRWYAAMTARRKVLLVPGTVSQAELQARLEASISQVSQQEAVAKDFHLLIAALETDKIVLTRGERLRRILHTAAQQVGELRGLIFANPVASDEKVIAWLNRGAPAERHRCLGYKPRKPK